MSDLKSVVALFLSKRDWLPVLSCVHGYAPLGVTILHKLLVAGVAAPL